VKINYQKTINNYVIWIELESAEFSTDEELAMQELGEPVINYNKKYTTREFPVVFDRKLKTGFKVRVGFDGNDGALADAIEAANLFMAELKTDITALMKTLMDDYKAIKTSFKVGSGTININIKS
jgi:hypothetical protein